MRVSSSAGLDILILKNQPSPVGSSLALPGALASASLISTMLPLTGALASLAPLPIDDDDFRRP